MLINYLVHEISESMTVHEQPDVNEQSESSWTE